MSTQALAALEVGNRIRFARAKTKREIKAGEAEIADVLDRVSDELAGMTIGDLLRAQRYWGHGRAAIFLQRLGIPERRTCGKLTLSERSRLIEELS